MHRQGQGSGAVRVREQGGHREHGYKGEIRYNEKNLPVYVKGGDFYYNTGVVLVSMYENNVYYIEYEYDEKGNWIKQIVYEGEMKKPYTISDRTIVY